ncbi:hypothetical protein B484DRAFT_339095, partial [Ochromonadaceae sp. CCMP2298]
MYPPTTVNAHLSPYYCKCVLNYKKRIFQVTPTGVRVVDCASFALLSQYQPSGCAAGRVITVASGTTSQLVLAISGGELQYLELEGHQLRLVTTQTIDQDVACLSLRPISTSRVVDLTGAQGQGEMDVDEELPPAESRRSSLVALATWTDDCVRLLALPTLQEVGRLQLGSDTQARDVLLVELGGSRGAHMLVGLGDGRLITFDVEFDTEADGGSLGMPKLTNKRLGVLGTHPITFRCFLNAGQVCVLACCDRSTVIYAKSGQVLFTVLDAQSTDFTRVAPFHSESFPNCLALASESSLLIGVIEDVQKVHIQHHPLGQAPRRIVHSSTHGVYAVTAEKTSRGSGGETSSSRVLFLDEGSMEQIGLFELDPMEHGIAIATCCFDLSSASTGGTEYIVVGTAHMVSGELEPSRGRILL